MLVAAESEREGIDVGQDLWHQDQHAELWDWAHDPQHHRLGQDERHLNTARGKFIANVELNRRVVRVLPSLFGAAHHTVHNWTCERMKTLIRCSSTQALRCRSLAALHICTPGCSLLFCTRGPESYATECILSSFGFGFGLGFGFGFGAVALAFGFSTGFSGCFGVYIIVGRRAPSHAYAVPCTNRVPPVPVATIGWLSHIVGSRETFNGDCK